MLTTIIEFAFASVIGLYIADAASAIRDASKARLKEPKAQEPKAQEPKAQEPKAQEPKAQEPKAPKTKAPKTKAQEPKTKAPKAPRYRYTEPEGTQVTPGLGSVTPDEAPVDPKAWDTSTWEAPIVDTWVEEALALEAPKAPKTRRAARKPAETKAPKTRVAKA